MIRFASVTKQFGDDSYALRDVSFEVAPGEFVCITGPSGSGKTTLMRLLTKEYSPTHGDIFFHDQPLSHIKDNKVHEHRRRIGVIFQDYKLLPEFNVWENIALPLYIVNKPLEEIENRVTDLLKLVNLVDKAFYFPSQLSGGEAQRVSIARALAIGPSVIFADEPTGNLDPETSVAIAQLLTKINQLGTTILLATHDIGVLETLANSRRLHLNKGVLDSDTQAKTTKSTAKNSSKHDKPAPETHEVHEEIHTSHENHESHPDAQKSTSKSGLKLPTFWPFSKPPSKEKIDMITHTQVSVEDLDTSGSSASEEKSSSKNDQPKKKSTS
jgi:cell division transport system ATP-binding protein